MIRQSRPALGAAPLPAVRLGDLYLCCPNCRAILLRVHVASTRPQGCGVCGQPIDLTTEAPAP